MRGFDVLEQIMESHQQLRQQNRKRRAGLDVSQLTQAADALLGQLLDLDEYHASQRLAAYYAVNGEIGLDPVIANALSVGKQVFLPNLDQQSLRFSPYFHTQKMRINKFRLPEPDVDEAEMLLPEELDLVLAPLVVFDSERNRIGMGGGFYDRSFAFRKNPTSRIPVLMGVAHEFQRADRIIPQDWDVQLDMIVTDQSVYR